MTPSECTLALVPYDPVVHLGLLQARPHYLRQGWDYSWNQTTTRCLSGI